MNTVTHNINFYLPEGTDVGKFYRDAMKLADPDYIQIVWHIDDVKEIADVTDEQAREVLKAVKNNHDASEGINWETLRLTVDDLYPDAWLHAPDEEEISFCDLSQEDKAIKLNAMSREELVQLADDEGLDRAESTESQDIIWSLLGICEDLD